MGRTKQFDEQEVLEKAMLTFWQHGYENTSLRQLESSMGINQFSIYATFKSKQRLYERVLKTYTEQLNKQFLHDLLQEDCDLDDIHAFLEHFALSIKLNRIPNSCLMVGSTTQLDQFDKKLQAVIVDFFDSMKKIFLKGLQNSLTKKKISSQTNIQMTAEYLIGIAQSISIYSKIKSIGEIKRYIAFAISKV